MARLIEVEERDINYIFGKSKPYSPDGHQRDYRRTDTHEHKRRDNGRGQAAPFKAIANDAAERQYLLYTRIKEIYAYPS